MKLHFVSMKVDYYTEKSQCVVASGSLLLIHAHTTTNALS